MPYVKMKVDTPDRKKGKVYDVQAPENWELVRDGLAEHEYVPEAKQKDIPAKEVKKPAVAAKKTTGTVE